MPQEEIKKYFQEKFMTENKHFELNSSTSIHLPLCLFKQKRYVRVNLDPAETESVIMSIVDDELCMEVIKKEINEPKLPNPPPPPKTRPTSKSLLKRASFLKILLYMVLGSTFGALVALFLKLFFC